MKIESDINALVSGSELLKFDQSMKIESDICATIVWYNSAFARVGHVINFLLTRKQFTFK